MSLYFTLLNALLLLSAVILLRHSWARFRYFLQMFQQHGYKVREYFDWLFRYFYSKVVLPEHVLFMIVLFCLLLFLSERLTITASTLILSVFTLFWFWPAGRFQPEKDKKPLVYTARMTRLAVVKGAIVLFLVLIILDLSFTGRLLNTPIFLRESSAALMAANPYFLLFGLLLADISIPLFLILAAWITWPLEKWFHSHFKKKARKKIAGIAGLNVIAITGSYGKTSTKFILAALLQERFNVCFTPGSYNTPMGICKVINNKLKANHQILLLEMGARYEGNIAELCAIARPDIAIVTNTGKAHLETFGSQEAIVREKSTLARELKSGGLLVLNGDDPDTASFASLRDDLEVVLTGLDSGTVRATGIQYDENGTRFTMLWTENGTTDEKTEVRLKLLGEHNVHNFLLAAAVARSLGIRAGTLSLAAEQIEPVEHRLELKRQNGLVIIDDAFNSNPVGAENALEILTTFPSGRKIIVTPGMIELGELQDQENREFGNKIAEAGLDLVILVGERQTKPILEGIREVTDHTGHVRVVGSLFEANSIVKEFAREGDVVLYENDLPDTYSE